VENASRFLPLRSVDWNPVDAPPKPGKSWDTCVVPIRTWNDAVLVMDWLKTGQHPFKSVSLDSVSELQYRNVESHVGRSTAIRIQDWGTVLRDVGGFVRDLRDLTFHPANPIDAVVITAMSRTDKDGILRPHLQGQMQAVIPYLPDVCAYLYVDTDEHGIEVRRILTRRRDGKEAGQRVNGWIPPVMNLPQVTGSTIEEIIQKNITYQLIMKKVFGAGKGIAPPVKQEPLVAGPSDDEEKKVAAA
jgi:hypothetical protein